MLGAVFFIARVRGKEEGMMRQRVHRSDRERRKEALTPRSSTNRSVKQNRNKKPFSTSTRRHMQA